MAALRHPLPVAVPPFHGDRMDVPRGLRSRWLLGVAPRSGEGAFCESTNHIAATGSIPVEYFACLGTATKVSLLCGNRVHQFRILLLRFTIRPSQIQRGSPSTPCRIDHLSSIIVCSDERFSKVSALLKCRSPRKK